MLPPAKHYLTGTGNSRRVATWFADAAVEHGLDVRMGPMESARPEEELERSPGHLLGLLLPAHGFTAPWSMVRFAARMPRGRGMHAFVVSTRGGSQIGPCRFPGMEGTALHSGMGQAAYDSIMSHSRPLAARFIDRILSGGRFYGSLICLAQGIALAPVSAGYLAVGRFGLAKLFFPNLRCDGCGVCATNCPRQTVEASQGFGAVLFKRPGFVMAALIPAVAAFAAKWSWGKYVTGGLGMQLLSIPVALLTMWATYRMCHQLTAWRAVRAFVANATFTRFYRRYHEPSTRLAQLQETGTARYRAAGTAPCARANR